MAETLTTRDFWRLQTLGDCPLPVNQPWTPHMFQVGILWIEETQVRLYKPEDRETLRNFSNPEEWAKAVRDYCDSLSVPCPSTGTHFTLIDLKNIFQSLLKRAIEEVYADAVQSEEMKVAQMELDTQLPDHQTKGLSNKMFDLVTDITASQADLEAVVTAVGRKPNTEEALQLVVSRAVPSEVKSEDFVIKAPSPVIAARLVAQTKLAEIQLLVNECLSDLQLQTADPKADYRLGKVGI